MNLQDPKDAVASKLLKSVSSQDTIFKAWRVIEENARASSKTNQKEIDRFAADAGANMRSLCNRLSHRRFEFGKARGVPIPKVDVSGKRTGIRPIVIASIEDRIVQRAILDTILKVPGLSIYIHTPHSFGGLRRPAIKSGASGRDDPSAVPAAIKAVLDAIEGGAKFYASADIQSFFSRIHKPHVIELVRAVVNDCEFSSFFEKAITTELSNLAELRGKAADFPIEDIGVAQGNSLSPLVGNIVLAEFDQQMNQHGCRCIRYIDDFVILAPTRRAVNDSLARAKRMLGQMGMQLSPEKSSKGAISVDEGLTFLGIEVAPGIIRPSKKARSKFLRSISDEFDHSIKNFNRLKLNHNIDNADSLISTLKRVQGKIDGWGKHYWFCNEVSVFTNLDRQILKLVRAYIGDYTYIKSQLTEDKWSTLLGIPTLLNQKRDPFHYPSVRRRV